jgi:hypothetical protein
MHSIALPFVQVGLLEFGAPSTALIIYFNTLSSSGTKLILLLYHGTQHM